MLCQDFLNNYFLTNAERIRHDKDHVVLHVPKEGPASAEMVENHWKLALEFFASSPDYNIPNLKIHQETLICLAKRYGIFAKQKGYGRIVKDWARQEAPAIRCLLVHTLSLVNRSKSSRSPYIRTLKETLHLLLAQSGASPEAGIEAALEAATAQEEGEEASTPSSTSASPPCGIKAPTHRHRGKAPQKSMDELETQLEMTMDELMAEPVEPTGQDDTSRRQAAKDWCATMHETKPLMILKPDMPDVSASSVKLEEVEVNTDAYKAQLVQQKAKRVEAAEALLSKANQDPKAVKKTHTKNARGRGRGGRGRGRGKTPNQDDQEPSATTADDEHKEGMGDEHVDEKPGEGDEGNSVPENNGEGGEADGKKKYKRKTFTNDELDVMWKDRVQEFKQIGINIPEDYDHLAAKSFTLKPPASRDDLGSLGVLWTLDQIYVNRVINPGADTSVKTNKRDGATLRSYGIDCRSFDILKNPLHDLASAEGFCIALTKTLRVKRNGVIWGGNPCSSWIWISAHSTKRRSSLGVMGDEEVPSVALANCLAARFALLAMVCVVRGLFWCVEQPMSSLLPQCPYMAHVLTNMMPAFFQRTWLGAFQHWCCKPTQLFGSWPSLEELKATLSKQQRRALKESSDGMYTKKKRPDGSTQAAQEAIAQGERRKKLVQSVVGVGAGPTSQVLAKRDRSEVLMTPSTQVTPETVKKHCEGHVTPRALSFSGAEGIPAAEHPSPVPSSTPEGPAPPHAVVSASPEPAAPAPSLAESPPLDGNTAAATPIREVATLGTPLTATPPPPDIPPTEPDTTTPAPASAGNGTPVAKAPPMQPPAPAQTAARETEDSVKEERARWGRFTRRSQSKKAPPEIALKFRQAQAAAWLAHSKF
ncbi:unnamed protein product [Cladocopium goreaui]|uniref:Uncharacterized protein n=1 Tax=Cladocopium goreaui TaxID=2562237 RepID=A0A9P1FNG6_9DINO|nr:unnamed protein product [Cladocopium goreaui]